MLFPQDPTIPIVGWLIRLRAILYPTLILQALMYQYQGYMPRTLFLILKEGGEPIEFTVRLTAQPRDGPVTVHALPVISNGPLGRFIGPYFTISSQNLVFTAGTNSNWNIPQTVTITPRADNNFDEGPAVANYVVSMQMGQSTINPFRWRDRSNNFNIEGRFFDDGDTAGLVVSPTNLGEVAEGDITSFTIKLNSEPTATVTVDFDDVTGGTAPTINPATVTFAPAQWNDPQTVSITVRLKIQMLMVM